MSIWDNIKHDNNIVETYEKKTSKKSKKNTKFNCRNKDITITKKGIKISTQLLKDLEIQKKIINMFTIKIKTITGYYKIVQNHKIDTKYNRMILPRFGFLEYIENNFKNYNIINNIKSGEVPSIEFKWNGSFAGNQSIIATHIMKNQFSNESVKAGKAGLVLNLQAGQGKTFLAVGLMEKIQKKSLIVCHNKTIMYQWVEVLKGAYPNNKIGVFYGDKKEHGCDITVAIINTLLLQDASFFKQFGYMILDEVHEYCSKTRKQIYNMGQCTYMLGLSATPDRIDGLNKINDWCCGSVLVASELDGYTEDDIPFKGEVTMLKYIGHPNFTKIITNKALDIVSFSEMVTQLCDDYYRTHLIVKSIYELRKNNMNIFVFADRRKYLSQIKEELDRFNIINEVWDDYVDVKSNRLVGGATAEEIKQVEEQSNVILTTYQFMGTGKSIPKMDAIILTTPRKTKSRQYINRIFRLGSNYNIVRKIIDVVDWSTSMKGQWYNRKKYYDEMSYPISVKRVSYEELEPEMIEMGILCYDNSTDDDPINKSLTELEELLNKTKVLELELEDLELLNQYSD